MIGHFLDAEGKIKTWPSKHMKQRELLTYLSGKFEPGRVYAEREVNAVIESWHSFGDLFLLRRGMIDAGVMTRTRDGSEYRLADKA